MTSRTLLRRSAAALLLAIATPALAEYTVTITNDTPDPIVIAPKDHACLHDPSYFDKTVPGNGKIEVHAKWSQDAGCLSSSSPAGVTPYVNLCRTDTGKCGVIDYSNDDKRVLLTTEGGVAVTGEH